MHLLNTVLIVDDNNVNRQVLTKILQEEYAVLTAANGKEALELLRAHSSHIAGIMLDLVMPIMDGYEFLREINKVEEYKNIPVLVSTSNSDRENEKEALKLGAWDFISKPYDADIIRFRLNNAIVRSQLTAFNQLKYIAEYDTLTDIYNKHKFYEEASQILKNYPDTEFVMVRLDVDRFSLINSFYGNLEGDRLLRYIAKHVRKMAHRFPPYAYARIEADVFAMLLSRPGEALLDLLIKEGISTIKAFNTGYDISASFGIYVIEDHSMPADIILDRATLAAKRVKGNSLISHAYYSDEIRRAVETEQRITNEMNSALAGEQFTIFLQPKYSLQTNAPVGAEALVRWIQPQRGVVSPGEFIPVFEKNGFITKLDYCVWEQTCRLLRKWIDEGRPLLPISVNVSRVNLYNPKLVENICDLVEKYNIPSNLINLELTESAYTDNPTVMQETMEKLQQKGFVIMMDDFGTGYSSLNILKDIAVDVLKIDMRFLSKSRIAGRGESIIASIVRMSKWLKIPTVAEGVETLEQVEFLRSIGCEYVQGFYFAKPLPVGDCEKLFEDSVVSEKKLETDFEIGSLWAKNTKLEELFSDGDQPLAIYEYSPGGSIEILRMNNAYFRLFGYGDMQNVASPLSSVPGDYLTGVKALFAGVVKNHGEDEYDYPRELEDGRIVWVSLRLKYINSVGQSHILFGSMTDISLQRELSERFDKFSFVPASN